MCMLPAIVFQLNMQFTLLADFISGTAKDRLEQFLRTRQDDAQLRGASVATTYYGLVHIWCVLFVMGDMGDMCLMCIKCVRHDNKQHSQERREGDNAIIYAWETERRIGASNYFRHCAECGKLNDG